MAPTYAALHFCIRETGSNLPIPGLGSQAYISLPLILDNDHTWRKVSLARSKKCLPFTASSSPSSSRQVAALLTVSGLFQSCLRSGPMACPVLLLVDLGDRKTARKLIGGSLALTVEGSRSSLGPHKTLQSPTLSFPLSFVYVRTPGVLVVKHSRRYH